MPNFYGYLRQSRDEKVQHNSALYQEEALRLYHADHESALPPWAEPTVDIDVRGKVPFDERPGGKSLMAKLGAGDCLAVWKLDRLSRRLFSCMGLLGTLLDRGVRIIAVADRLDFDTAMGRAMVAMYAVFAEIESDNISIRTKAGLTQARARGRKLGGRRRFGYNRRNGRVIINVDEHRQAARMLRWHASGKYSMAQIAKMANQRGWTTSMGKQWEKNHVNKLFRRIRGEKAARAARAAGTTTDSASEICP